jgi:hypothetical protein
MILVSINSLESKESIDTKLITFYTILVKIEFFKTKFIIINSIFTKIV